MKSMWKFYIILSTIFLALSSFTVKNVKKSSPLVVVFWQFLMSMSLVFAYSFMLDQKLIFNPMMIILGLTYLISLSLYYYSLKISDLSKAAPVFNLSSTVSAILGIIFLSEQINAKIVGGIIFAAFGIYLLGGKK
ncbi:MAG: EamA family transporter [Candidatus Nanoarchaeia archaeon]|nr:EamA family transporter [Candidatus Nanoarchaeia archaeon]MDD5499335.1 EamA family transporter [Candidatus Nanoarchaeia archaeon]